MHLEVSAWQGPRTAPNERSDRTESLTEPYTDKTPYRLTGEGVGLE